MRDELRVLVVSGAPGLADDVRDCISQSQAPFAVQWLGDAAMALARLGGGDIDALVIDPASLGISGGGREDFLERLRAACPLTDTVVVAGSRDWTSDLRRIVAASHRHTAPAGMGRSSRAGRKLRAIGFLGAKGGVGATTVALNTAFALAQKHSAVLAELGSGNDTLTLRVRTTAKSAPAQGAAMDGLWSVKGTPGLRIALAQDVFKSEPNPETVAGEIETMGAEADYLVLDLGAVVTPVVRCVLPRLDTLGIVVDQEMLSMECAQRLLSAIVRPELCPREAIGIVIVNRASLACPCSVDEAQKLLGITVLAAIPSAADLCSAAQRARRPVVAFEPESLAAQCLTQLAFSLAELT